METRPTFQGIYTSHSGMSIGLQGTDSTFFHSPAREWNPRHSVAQTNALLTELTILLSSEME